jgi:hypothetical protein
LNPVPLWARAIVQLLDGAIAIPGTRIRIGLDPIIGFLAPGAGDAVGAFATLSLFWLGWKLRVPRVVLLRMLLNIGIDSIIGAVPVLGDLFDVYFHAAERNLALLQKHGGRDPSPPSAGDYAVVALALVVVVCLLALPIVAGLFLIHLATEWFRG